MKKRVEEIHGTLSLDFHSPNSAYTHLLDEDVILHPEVIANKVMISFTYEEFMEYVMARSIVNKWQGLEYEQVWEQLETILLSGIYGYPNFYMEGVLSYIFQLLEDGLLLSKADKTFFDKNILYRILLSISDADFSIKEWIFKIIERMRKFDSNFVAVLDELLITSEKNQDDWSFLIELSNIANIRDDFKHIWKKIKNSPGYKRIYPRLLPSKFYRGTALNKFIFDAIFKSDDPLSNFKYHYKYAGINGKFCLLFSLIDTYRCSWQQYWDLEMYKKSDNHFYIELNRTGFRKINRRKQFLKEIFIMTFEENDVRLLKIFMGEITRIIEYLPPGVLEYFLKIICEKYPEFKDISIDELRKMREIPQESFGEIE